MTRRLFAPRRRGTGPVPFVWRRGFSLIEILIAIIILALGLLGLGAVFPVVIREQKQAQDRIAGTLAEDNIRAALRGFERLNQKPRYIRTAEVGRGLLAVEISGWATLQEEWNYLRELARPTGVAGRVDFSQAFDFSEKGLWEVYWGAWNNAEAPNAYAVYATTGDVVLVDDDRTDRSVTAEEFPPAEREALLAELRLAGDPNPAPLLERRFLKFRMPLSARLNPTGDPADGAPVYVWDFVARRKLETSDPRALQVAVFVRRVDPRLRPIPRVPAVAGNDTISVREQILSGALGTRNRLPLGEDASGLPTLDGTGGSPGVLNYSGIHQVQVSFVPNPQDPIERKRDRIRVVGATGADLALIRQLGQRVIDNLGNVYTITGFSGNELRVDPPVPPSVLATDPDPLLTSIRQLIFTPQIPVLAFVMEVEP